MYFEDIPYYRVFEEVRRCVAETVLPVCDTAESLGGQEYGLEDINDLYGTKYEDIIPAFISRKWGASDGNMWGNIFRFKLTPPLREHILEESLTCMFREGENLYLENLILYSGEKVIFTCVSHEVFSLYHMAEVDDSLSQKILSAVNSTLQNMPLFGAMQKTAARLKDTPKKKIEKDLHILFDLCLYVDEEKQYFIRQIPKYKCSFKNFKGIAKQYLTEQTYCVLAPLTGFSELQPLPVPKTWEDVLSGVSQATHYILSPYYKVVERELSMLKYVLCQ